MEGVVALPYRRQLALGILHKLNEHGHAAYLVGGCVRDMLVGRPTKDIDIATSAMPLEVTGLFSRVEPTGLPHGTVTVLCDGVPFEVTTFRTESGYADYRRPTQVEFIADINGDLARRDFTINAMAQSAAGELIDPFGGAEDLRNRLLRCVGDAAERFGEDALRLLRCIRFAAEYGLEIEPATWDALLLRRELLKHVAIERVRVELEKTIEGGDPDRGLMLLADSGLMCELGVETGLLQRERSLDIHAHAQSGGLAYGALPDGDERWALLLLRLGVDAEQAEEALRRLTFAKRRAKAIAALVAVHRRMDEQLRSADTELCERPELLLRLLAVRCGREAALSWLRLLEAGIAAGDPLFAREPLNRLAADGAGAAAIADLKAATAGELAIGGADLIRLGYAPGPTIGRTINKLLELAALQTVGDDRKALLLQAELWLKEREGI